MDSIIRIKEHISGEVCMGTFGLVELELREMEKSVRIKALRDAIEAIQGVHGAYHEERIEELIALAEDY